MSALRCFFVTTLFVLSAMSAHAQITLITSVGDGSPEYRSGAYGLVFIANRDITIRSMGFYDHGGDGLATSHRVGVGSGSGVDFWPFAQVTIPAGTEAYYEDGFRWVNLATPVVLFANTYYSLAGEMIMHVDPLLIDNYSPGSVVLSNIVTGSAGRLNPSTWYNPDMQTGSNIWMAANLSEKLMPVPEPSITVLLVGGIAAGVAWIRRREHH